MIFFVISLKFQNCHKIAFADDLHLIVQVRHFQDACTLLQYILNYIFDWSKKYKLNFNIFKTKVLKIYKKSIIDQCIDLNLGGVTIEEVRKMKYLGIIFYYKMQ